ncbi:MAG: 3-hydroxyacyl-CoA dehydrogenase [Rhodospirillales bacterium]
MKSLPLTIPDANLPPLSIAKEMTMDWSKDAVRLGVVGTGAMGRGIAQVSATGGMDVMMFDAAPGGAAKARGAIVELLKSLVAKGRMSEAEVAAAEQRLKAVDNIADLAPCDVVIEAVFEDLAVKRALFKELEAALKPDAIIASNTSSIRIASIAASCQQRGRIAGMHYFNPVPLMKLVEVIRSADTAPQTVEALTAIGKRQGRVPVTVGDTPGFLVNLGGTAIGTEGLRIYQEGVATPSQIDAVMRDTCGFRMGPFELMDLTGIDVNFPARRIIYEGFFHDRRMTPSPLHESLFHAGRLGRKTKAGWYDYNDKGEKIDHGADATSDVAPAMTIVVPEPIPTPLMVLLRDAEIVTKDDGKSPILLAPVGEDCSSACIRAETDPKRTIAIDALGDVAKRVTIMTAPAAKKSVRDSVVALLLAAGTKVTVINDSPGFIGQRIRCMIANLGCEMAQQRIASPADIDTAMTLGLNYPQGPLAMADTIGVRLVFTILTRIQAITGDDRYRPSQWLRRRALLGLPAATLDGAA